MPTLCNNRWPLQTISARHSLKYRRTDRQNSPGCSLNASLSLTIHDLSMTGSCSTPFLLKYRVIIWRRSETDRS